jgi:hypothetical protein
MAYTVNWVTKLITVPQADLLALGGGIYQLNVLDFRKEVRRLLWTQADGLWAIEAINWIPSVTIGGTPYAALLEMINGYTIEFEDLQYAVNIIGANSNMGDVTVVNQVSVRPQNSAGLINLDVLLASAYQGIVIYDDVGGQAGATSPVGTVKFPSNNWPETKIIADDNGIKAVQIIGSATLDIANDFTGFTFQGRNNEVDILTVDSVAVVPNAVFRNMAIAGTLDGNSSIECCNVGTLSYVSGRIIDSTLGNGTITLTPATQADVINCRSGIAGGGVGQTTSIDCAGSGSLTLRGFIGGVEITNITGSGDISLDITGRVIFTATCTGGSVTVRGDCQIEDNSGVGCDVIDRTSYTRVNELWKRLGLDPDAPLVTNEDGSISVGGITIGAVTTGVTPNRQTTQTRT